MEATLFETTPVSPLGVLAALTVQLLAAKRDDDAERQQAVGAELCVLSARLAAGARPDTGWAR